MHTNNQRLVNRMVPPFVLCQPSLQVPFSHAPAPNHWAFCLSPRHSHHPRLRRASGLGNRTPPTTPQAWTHQRSPSQQFRWLGFLGWRIAHSPPLRANQHGHHLRTPSQRDSCRPLAAGNHRCTTPIPTSRHQPSLLGWTGSRPSCPPAPWPRWQRHAAPFIPSQLPATQPSLCTLSHDFSFSDP